MSIKETIRAVNRWDYRGFGWADIFCFGAVFFFAGVGLGFAAAIVLG